MGAGWIEANPTKIHQILVNLCANVFQAMEGGKGVLPISLERRKIDKGTIPHGEITPGTYIVLQVSDNGHGMDLETREQVFNPFFSTEEVGKGTGLGLSVLHGIVKDYSGYVEVESVPGEGSTFRVFLPVIEGREADNIVAEQSVDREKDRGGEEILVVDDDPLLVRLSSRILSNIGYRVTETVSSQEALEKIRNELHRFDLLIMCTGFSNIVSKKDALAMGICCYVYKPVKAAELVSAVREALDERGNHAA